MAWTSPLVESQLADVYKRNGPFYLFLRLTNYPTTCYPFKFWGGAPVVVEFINPAVRGRTKVQGPFDDQAMQAARVRAEQAIRSVKLVLSPAASETSMEKMTGEFPSGAFLGPFETREEVRLDIQAEIRKSSVFEFFVVNAEWITFSPQFSVEETPAFNQEVFSRRYHP